jgi:type I restriction enzyme S subunit
MRAFLVQRPSSAALRALNYAPELERIRQAGSAAAQPLGALLSGIGDSYWSVFTRRDCAPEFGIELLTQTDMFSAEPMGRVIRRDSMPSPDLHRVKRWQVLVAGAGQMNEGNLFGRSIIADGRLTHGYLGPHAVAMTFSDPGSAENLWTYAYLNSAAGIGAIKTAAFGTSVPGLRLDRLKDIPVPIPDRATMARVAGLIRSVVDHREKFLESLKVARALVSTLPDVAEALELCGTRERRTQLWDGPLPTLCAWNAISSGGALDYLSKKWHTRLGDVVQPDGIYNGPRFARIDCQPPHGVELMSQRDAMLIRPSPRRVAHPGFDDRLLFAPEGTILVGGHGTLGEGEIFGRAVLVHGRYSRAAFTQDLLRVVAKPKHQNSLYAYLTTTLGFRLLRTTAVGTKILLMREDLLRSLPVPDWPADLETRVATAVRSAFRARSLADEAETEAIRIVEDEVLPQWLA